MAKFYEQVKTLISDIERFLETTTKDVKLPKKAVNDKNSILKQIAALRGEFPQLHVQPMGTSKSSGSLTSDDQDNLYEETEHLTKPAIEADDSKDKGQKKDKGINGEPEDLTKKEVPANGEASDIKMQAFLVKRKGDKKGGNLLNKLKKQDRYWCLLRKDLLYLYEKNTSKKQKECICLKDYRVTRIDDGSKKEFSFELACEGKKTHVFDSANAQEQIEWIEVLGKAAGTIPTDTTELLPPDGYYDEADIDVARGGDIEEVLYEDTTALSGPPPARLASDSSPEASNNNTKPPLPAFNTRPTPAIPGPDDDQDIYDDDLVTTGGSSYKSKSPSASVDEEIYDDTEAVGGDDIYDDTEALPVSNKSTLHSQEHTNLTQRVAASVPSLPGRGRPADKPLPPPPKDVPNSPKHPMVNGAVKPQQPGDIYESMYYGLWNCRADQDNELSFQRGDIIHVLSKKYDDKGWWVGRLNGRVGVVPSKYLTRAYDKL